MPTLLPPSNPFDALHARPVWREGEDGCASSRSGACPRAGDPTGRGHPGPPRAEGCGAAPSCFPSRGNRGPVQQLLEGHSVGDTDRTAQAHSGIWAGGYCSRQIWTCDFAY